MKARYGGKEVYVQFSNGGDFRWVSTNDLLDRKPTDFLHMVEESNNRHYSPRSRTSRKDNHVQRVEIPSDDHYLLNRTHKLPSDDIFVARRMIEAFRVGIAPPDRISDFTFGRDREINSVNSWLQDWTNNIMLLIGDYGMGKTHLVQYIYQKALNQGYAVAKVDADPNEAPFFRPKRIYGSLLHSLQYRDPGSGMIKGSDVFLKTMLERGQFADHIYLKFVNWHQPATWHWIKAAERAVRPSGEEYKELPGLHDHQTAANIYTHLLSTFGWASKRVLGLKGLVLIFDEAESMNILDGYQLEKGMNFFRAIVNTALNNELLLKPPEQIRGLTHGGHSAHVPFLFRRESGMKLVFAFTRLWWDHYVPELNDAARMSLEPIGSNALRSIQERIAEYYQEAYMPFRVPAMPTDDVIKALSFRNGNTRKFVKSCVEVMDIARAGNLTEHQVRELVHSRMNL